MTPLTASDPLITKKFPFLARYRQGKKNLKSNCKKIKINPSRIYKEYSTHWRQVTANKICEKILGKLK